MNMKKYLQTKRADLLIESGLLENPPYPPVIKIHVVQHHTNNFVLTLEAEELRQFALVLAEEAVTLALLSVEKAKEEMGEG